MLISYAFDWQDKQLRLSTALLPGNYKIQLHFNGNLVAVDETSDESQSLTLINGYSCLKEKLDIVAVKDSLYCIDLAEATALSMGKFLNQETRPSFALLVFATLIQNSPLTDAQMLRMFRILNRYMANTGKPKYLGSLEQQHNSSGIVSDSFFYRRSLLSHLYMPELEYLFVKGVYSEIVKAGGGFSENNMSHHLYMSGFYTHLIILAALNYYATSGSINRIKIRAWFLIIALACTGSYAFLKWIHLSR